MNNFRQGQPYLKDFAAVNEIRQKFEEVARPILNGGITRAPVANLFDRNPHYPDEYKFRDVQVAWGTYQAVWRAAYEAGESAMKEKAAELRESLKLICAEAESWHTMHDHDGNGLVQCDSICALIPRMKAALSGAEEAKKENG